MGKKSEMIQLTNGNCLRTKTKLLHITKVHCFVNNMEKLVSIMRLFFKGCIRESLI